MATTDLRERPPEREGIGAGKEASQPGIWRYNDCEMSATLVRRILYGAMAAWVLIMAVEEFRLSGHTGTAIAFGVGGIVLALLAISGKGG